jgi:hypothetical protein
MAVDFVGSALAATMDSEQERGQACVLQVIDSCHGKPALNYIALLNRLLHALMIPFLKGETMNNPNCTFSTSERQLVDSWNGSASMVSAPVASARLNAGGLRDETKWKQIHDAVIDAMVRLERALKPLIAKLQV